MIGRNMLQQYGGFPHMLPYEPPNAGFAPMPFEGGFNPFGGGKQQFPQPFNPIPFEGGMDRQKLPWWMRLRQPNQAPMSAQQMSPVNALRGFGGLQQKGMPARQMY